jgi:hypothetical protein
MSHPIQNTDAYILMSFRDALEEWAGKPITHDIVLEMAPVVAEYTTKLLNVGHELSMAKELLREVFTEARKAIDNPAQQS